MQQVARYEHAGRIQWGVVLERRLHPLRGEFETTGTLLSHGRDAIRSAFETPSSSAVLIDEVKLLSPVTESQQVICLAKNYREHTIETGFDPAAKTFNMLFRKASSCLCGARDAIQRPARVRLLDYEVELGLVLGRDLNAPEHFEGPLLPDAIGALVVHNDVSARDIQVPQLQFYKGKSFRTFGPTGPWLTLVDEELRGRWSDLRLQMHVNGELRQNAACVDMIYKPPETLTELSEVQSLRVGDLIASGTPSGVAMQRPPEQNALLEALPPAEKWPKFIELQEASGRYLHPGDRVRASIRTDDGEIDLGVLDNEVTGA